MTIVAAIHGILNRQSRLSWVDDFDVWCAKSAPGARVLKKEYWAGPWPRLNWWRNGVLAKGLAAEVAAHCAAAVGRAPVKGLPGLGPRIWLIGHSNGAVIALKTAERLIRSGLPINGLILVGAACQADVEKNGVMDWILEGRLGKAIAFSSKEDGVVDMGGLKWFLKWPYGDLGRRGWLQGGLPIETGRISTRWCEGGHNGYFAPDRLNKTFGQWHTLMLAEQRDEWMLKGS